ncbi:MAG TPA: response regulator [Myxococcus sp.]|nr:response regulator [Myxococcus sp.]
MVRILIVDDEVQVLESLRRLLRREGFDIEVALSGEEALRKLGTFAADIVISDFRMRGMNGAELLGQVMAQAPDTVRVLLSGQADLQPGSLPSSTTGIISHFLTKPWDNQHFLSEVRNLLGQLPPSR